MVSAVFRIPKMSPLLFLKMISSLNFNDSRLRARNLLMNLVETDNSFEFTVPEALCLEHRFDAVIAVDGLESDLRILETLCLD